MSKYFIQKRCEVFYWLVWIFRHEKENVPQRETTRRWRESFFEFLMWIFNTKIREILKRADLQQEITYIDYLSVLCWGRTLLKDTLVNVISCSLQSTTVFVRWDRGTTQLCGQVSQMAWQSTVNVMRHIIVHLWASTSISLIYPFWHDFAFLSLS